MNQALAVPDQTNMAPLKPIQAISEKRENPVYLSDALKELIKDMLSRDKDVFKEIAATSEVTSNFIQGKQIWAPNYWTNQWKIVPVNRADPNKITSINIMQFYCTTQLKMLTSSNPDLEPVDQFKQKQYREKIKIAKAVWNSYESKFYTPWFNTQEALHMIISGTYIESVRYDPLKAGTQTFREIFENKSVELFPGYSKCFECDNEGGYKDFVGDDGYAACPECGSNEVLPPQPAINHQYNSVAGVEPVSMGSLDLRLIPIQAARFDVKKRIEDSTWAIERVVISKGKLKYLLGNMDFPLDETERDPGVEALENISRAGNTLAGQHSHLTPQKKYAIVDRVSFKPEDVAHIVLKEDTQTLSGHVIPAGRLSDNIPPEGATLLAINDGSLIIGLYLGSHHSQEMSSGVYHARLESGLGRGSEDTVEVQKRFNRNDAQLTKYGETSATPAHTFVKGAVDKQHIKSIGKPQAAIPINREIAQALGTTELIRTIQPGNVAAQFFEYTYNILNQYRQLTSHSTSFTEAFPGVKNDTATGAKLAKSNADSVFGPTLQIKARARVTTAQNTLRLHNRHFQGISQYYSFGQTESKRDIGRHVRGEEVDPDIEFTVVRNSEQPKTDMDRQADFVNMMTVAQLGGGYSAMKQQDPQLAMRLLKVFDIEMDGETYDTMVDVCEARLEQALGLKQQFDGMKEQLTAMGMQVPDFPVETILLGLDQPIIVEESDHDKKAKWFMEYLDTPDGFNLNSDERSVIALLVRTHFQTWVQQQGMMAAGFTQTQVIGNQPAQDAANEDQQNQQNRQSQIEDKKNQQEHDKALTQHQLDLQKSEQDRSAGERQAVLDSALRMHEAENASPPQGAAK